MLRCFAELDVVTLSRLQFALTIMFHYLFPPLTIGLGVVLVYLEGMYLRTKDPLYESAAKFWTQDLRPQLRPRRRHRHRHGVRVRHELGRRTRATSATCSAPPSRPRASSRSSSSPASWRSCSSAGIVVGPKMHFFATCMVALGGIFSSVWIVVANSWQQTPAGHVIPRARHQRPIVPAGRDRRLLGDGLQPVEREPADPRLARRVHPRRVLRDEHLRLVPAQRPPPRIRLPLVHRRPAAGHDLLARATQLRPLPSDGRRRAPAGEAGRRWKGTSQPNLRPHAHLRLAR